MSDLELFSETQSIAPEDVRELIAFSPGEPAGSIAVLQSEGVAALYNYLCCRDFAYLADEVGTGKTYQALGVAALVWHLKPSARILFIAPRQSVQVGWVQEYERFFRTNYLAGIGGDDRARSLLLGSPIHRAEKKVENLREWLVLLNRPHRVAAFLRHTSFMRPIYTGSATDASVVWDHWRQQLANLGLHQLPANLKCPKDKEVSWVVNMAFAKGLNQFLSGLKGSPTFDLVVVDEAQCLRNPANQSNSVLHTVLKDRVRKWLFLSATPAHSGVSDIATVLNHYPDSGEVIEKGELEDLAKLQSKLQQFMVRRPRAYVVNGQAFTKDRYREDRDKEWAEVSQSALATLAMGLVQKRLVPVLQKKSYRYHIGLLSSFESLQSSVRYLEKPTKPQSDNSDDESGTDFYTDAKDRAIKENDAPDSGFIDRLSAEFQDRFKFPLPHPKLDRVVKEVARLAFGEDGMGEQPQALGGEKLLIFTRRISTVAAMRERLDAIYHRRVEERVKRCWNRRLDWMNGTGNQPDDEPATVAAEYDIERVDEGGSGLRFAMQDTNWLGRFRRTFRGTGRNALFFEENWLLRICRGTGKDPMKVAEATPDALWAESAAYAVRRSGNEFSLHRASRLHYLAYHGVSRYPTWFGLNETKVSSWRTAMQHVLPSKVTDVRREELPSDDPHLVDTSLFSERTFWVAWDEMFREGNRLALPGNGPNPDPEALYRRKVLQTIIGQTIRLTDALVDIYCCSEHDDKRADTFLQWLAGDDRDARRLYGQFADWIAHLDLILASALGVTDPLEKLAQRNYFEQLNAPAPVVGITGGSGGNYRATQQFRTPGYPLVIVCTDTLKEGVNLHLFCDRVVHYGVAWTSGDLEQRVGRVDRYFGRIERRLKAPGGEGSKLEIYYPYIANSIERDQVQRVIARKQQADALMDSPLSIGVKESTEIAVDYSGIVDQRTKLGPFARLTFERTTTPLLSVNRDVLRSRKAAYAAWAQNFSRTMNTHGVEVIGNPSNFRLPFQLCRDGRGHQVTWTFDADLNHYLLRISQPLGRYSACLQDVWVPHADLEQDRHGHEVLLVPDDPSLPPDGLAECFLQWIGGNLIEPERIPPWEQANNGSITVKDNQCGGRYVVEISFGARRHNIDLVLKKGIICASAIIVNFDQLPEVGLWDGPRNVESVRRWAKEESRRLPGGAIDLDQENRLRYAATLAYAPIDSPTVLCRFIELVGERADTYEAALSGNDIH